MIGLVEKKKSLLCSPACRRTGKQGALKGKQGVLFTGPSVLLSRALLAVLQESANLLLPSPLVETDEFRGRDLDLLTGRCVSAALAAVWQGLEAAEDWRVIRTLSTHTRTDTRSKRRLNTF